MQHAGMNQDSVVESVQYSKRKRWGTRATLCTWNSEDPAEKKGLMCTVHEPWKTI